MPFCPVPHTPRDQVWLGVGLATGAFLYSMIRKPVLSIKEDRLKTKSFGDSKVFTLVLTGGPCGGKSTGMTMIKKELELDGYTVYTVPEVPTILISGGCAYPGENGGELLMEFETGLIALQMSIEESFLRIAASTGCKSVVIFDRAIMDIPAYLPAQAWKDVLARNSLTEDSLADRYDMVLHMQTAAEGAEQFYTTANNVARTETAAQARELDKRINANWGRCCKHKVEVATNKGTTFDQKIEKAVKAVKVNIADYYKTNN